MQSLGNLKRLDLSECKSLTEKLNLTITPNLESLYLEGCENLSKIHSSIFHLSQLKLLNLRGCTSLQSLPDKNGLKSLERFYLSDCSGLEKLPDAMGNMSSLRLLYLNGTFIEELPFSIERLSRLSILSLQDCKNFSTLPSVLGGLSGLSSLKVLELPCSRFRDMDSGEGLIWKHLSHRITIKFSNDISVPLSNFHRDIVTAFYIRFDGQHCGIKNWDVITAKSRVSTSVCKVRPFLSFSKHYHAILKKSP